MPRLTVLGLDILDQPVVAPSLAYIDEFKHDLAVLKVSMPKLWGLHNTPTQPLLEARTRAILADVPGDVWLTETGGIVQLGSDFPNRKGPGLTRAARALSYMFKIAGTFPRIGVCTYTTGPEGPPRRASTPG